MKGWPRHGKMGWWKENSAGAEAQPLLIDSFGPAEAVPLLQCQCRESLDPLALAHQGLDGAGGGDAVDV
jgi:hypothetical protein